MPGLWLGASGGYGYGGESTINRVSANDLKGNLGFGLSAGIPVSHQLGSGLLNMHDRAARLDGTCTVTSGEGQGTTVRWQVPVDA